MRLSLTCKTADKIGLAGQAEADSPELSWRFFQAVTLHKSVQ